MIEHISSKASFFRILTPEGQPAKSFVRVTVTTECYGSEPVDPYNLARTLNTIDVCLPGREPTPDDLKPQSLSDVLLGGLGGAFSGAAGASTPPPPPPPATSAVGAEVDAEVHQVPDGDPVASAAAV